MNRIHRVLSGGNTPRGALCVLLLAQLGSDPRALAQPAPDVDRACTAIARLALPDTRILKSEAIHPAPRYAVPGTEQSPPRPHGPVEVAQPFCRVQGVVAPQIRFEVWLPLAGWNGRFQGLGVGAFLGALPYEPMAAALEQGYAVGGTDTGHQGGGADASWSIDAQGLNAELVADWAHRGIHEMTVKSKAVVRAMYGRPAGHSYFVGCSSGGHQALTEAQRYPADYDGILAGAPANYWTHLMAGQLWYGLATRTDPATDLEAPVSRIALIHEAALRACDAADGVRDGVIENPLACHFDPQVLRCQPGQTQDCLSAPQVQALQQIYGDAHDRDGKRIFPGLAPGSEPGWPAMSANQVSFAQTFYRYFVFQQPGWSYAGMDFGRDVATADQRIGGIVNSIDPDLRPFASRGGRLLQYHGWSDPLISPYNSVAYYESVLEQFGAGRDRGAALATVQRFDRLFMVPGMGHCRGGEGTDTFDGLGALQRWVEHGEAPARLEAARFADGVAVRTRPLCPYPKVARYQGSGSTDRSGNFACIQPPVMDNDRVTVWDTDTPLPAAAHDFIAIPLAHKGTALRGHRGDTPGQAGARTIIIELKDHVPTASPNTAGVPNAFPRPGAVKLLEDEQVIVWSYRWQPGQPSPMHFHDKDALVVYEEDSALKSTTPDGNSVTNHYTTGEVRYNPRGRIHSELLAGSGASAVITELK